MLKSGGYDYLKIFAFDGMRMGFQIYADMVGLLYCQDMLAKRHISKVLSDPAVRNCTHGLAVHWYMDQWIPVSWVRDPALSFPEKFILNTEAATGRG